ncbi:transcriptional regulator [Quadrisphaera sp. KR29]|uniref:transcriptional regulator n=1 Tax=Quadrisphaera sp. KR29 TaxID=3461391 RepID=UPI004043A77D
MTVTVEARRRRAEIASARGALRSSAAGPEGVREEIRASWARSAATVAPDLDVAPMSDPHDVERVWRGSPLQHAVRVMGPQLERAAEDGDLVVAVTDASARILWTSAGRVMRRRAESVGFAPGGRWDEASVGTNALDLALRTGTLSTVWSAEHYAHAVEGWVCWAAPVYDERTGRALGVVDLSTTWDRAQPLGPATAGALAQLVQHAASTAGPSQGLDQPTPQVLELTLLGPGEARLGGRRLPLTRRQLEVLALLALHPEGLSLPELHASLYGDAPVTTSTLKAEVSHVRAALGGALTSRPYRLALPVRTDVDAVLDAVAQGEPAAAAERYGGDLLAGTESPELRQTASYVTCAVREALLAAPVAEAALRWARTCPWDAEVLAAALAAAPTGAPSRALLAARLKAAEE